jgi:hypothetical protein
MRHRSALREIDHRIVAVHTNTPASRGITLGYAAVNLKVLNLDNDYGCHHEIRAS